MAVIGIESAVVQEISSIQIPVPEYVIYTIQSLVKRFLAII